MGAHANLYILLVTRSFDAQLGGKKAHIPCQLSLLCDDNRGPFAWLKALTGHWVVHECLKGPFPKLCFIQTEPPESQYLYYVGLVYYSL